jgi:hypothetical protein
MRIGKVKALKRVGDGSREWGQRTAEDESMSI